MSLWWCDTCKSVQPNGDYHCVICRRPLVFWPPLESALTTTAVAAEGRAVPPVPNWWISTGPCAAAEVAVPPVDPILRTYVERVIEAFEKDEQQGFHSRDRQYAIEMLRKGLAAVVPPVDSAPPRWLELAAELDEMVKDGPDSVTPDILAEAAAALRAAHAPQLTTEENGQ